MARYQQIDNANREIDRLRKLLLWYDKSLSLAQRVIDTTVAFSAKPNDPALRKAFEAAAAAYGRHKRRPI